MRIGQLRAAAPGPVRLSFPVPPPPFRTPFVGPPGPFSIDPRPAAIAIDPGGTRINHAYWPAARGGARNPVGYNRRSFYGFSARIRARWLAAFEGGAKPSSPRSLTRYGAGRSARNGPSRRA